MKIKFLVVETNLRNFSHQNFKHLVKFNQSKNNAKQDYLENYLLKIETKTPERIKENFTIAFP